MLYCEAPTTITYESREDLGYNFSFGLWLYVDDAIENAIEPHTKFYKFIDKKQKPDISKKYDEGQEGYVIADGYALTLTKAGTYVLYIRPGRFYGEPDKDFKLEPVFIIVSDDEGTSNDTKVASISLDKTKATLKKGKTTTLTATVTPSDATNKDVTWTSSNKKVATVNKNGKVTAKAKGKATITCKAADGSGEKVTCKVTVK